MEAAEGPGRRQPAVPPTIPATGTYAATRPAAHRARADDYRDRPADRVKTGVPEARAGYVRRLLFQLPLAVGDDLSAGGPLDGVGGPLQHRAVPLLRLRELAHPPGRLSAWARPIRGRIGRSVCVESSSVRRTVF
ncbi:hypothetical protein ACH4E7_41850 [Kitasatospora sp. NPDC018058]|uniref:hypothetical protein n=1 Tax=Kitasatospora sp. NPDC018058 TaxID=3364025 RepID=UPI0037BFEB2F